MSTENADIEAMVATLDVKIAALTEARTALTKFLGVSGDAPVLPGGGPGGIHSGTFYGKAIPEATRQFLGMCNKVPQPIRAIADALQKGGIETKAANFKSMVQVILRRVDNQSGEIMQMSDGTWALPEWFGKRATPKAKRKGKDAAEATPDSQAAPETATAS